MAPVMVWVVRNQHTQAVAGNKVSAPPVSAQSPHRLKLGDVLPHGLDDTPATKHGSQADGGIATQHHPIGRQLGIGGTVASGNQQHQMMPMVFCASLPPWPRLYAQPIAIADAETTCPRGGRNRRKVQATRHHRE